MAARITSFGPAEELRIVDVDVLILARPSDVLLRVVASGVNAIEWKIQKRRDGQGDRQTPARDARLGMRRRCRGGR